MGSVGVVNNHESPSLSRQGSLYDLTLDEVQSQLGHIGKPLGSMNLDEFLRTVWTAEAIDNGVSGSAQLAPAGSPLNRQSSFPQFRDLSKKTVEEVWREIQQENRNRNTLGEMTLETFLSQAGVSVERDVVNRSISNAGSGLGVNPNSQWMIQYQMVPQHVMQQQQQQPVVVSRGLLTADSVYSDSSMSDTQALGRKRVASGGGGGGDVVEKTVERRQKRMIKNRESAARSRQRRQAYTHELENKVSRLEEENKMLKQLKEMEKDVLPSAPPPEPKYQLRRTSSCPL